MIQLSGLSLCDDDNPDGDIEMEVVGLRPAKKLYEERLMGDNPKPTSLSRIMKAHDRYPSLSALRAVIDAFNKAIASNDTACSAPNYTRL